MYSQHGRPTVPRANGRPGRSSPLQRPQSLVRWVRCPGGSSELGGQRGRREVYPLSFAGWNGQEIAFQTPSERGSTNLPIDQAALRAIGPLPLADPSVNAPLWRIPASFQPRPGSLCIPTRAVGPVCRCPRETHGTISREGRS